MFEPFAIRRSDEMIYEPEPEFDVQGFRESGEFHLPPLTDSWALCAEGLAHPHTKKVRPIVFDHSLAAGRDEVVLCHLNHRLVQMCLRLLRAEIWSQDLAKKLNRFTACMVPDTVLQTPAVLIHGRLLVLGGDNQRIHEEIIVAGGLIREGRFSRMNVGEVRNALAAATAERPPGLIEDRLKELWPKIEAPLIQALEARMTERAKNLQKFLDERSEREVANVTAVMREMQYLRDLNRSGAPRLTPDMIELPSYWQSITPVLPHGATGQRRPAALRICRRTF